MSQNRGRSTCKYTHPHPHIHTQRGPVCYCLWLIRGGLTLPSHSPKNKRPAADVRELYQCSISQAAPGQPGRQEERPNCWRMAAGKEKDTADKCINYFINFILQLTLQATFQVSQPGEDVRGSGAGESSSTREKVRVREKMRWRKNPADNSFPCSLQKQRQKWPDNIVVYHALEVSTNSKY